MNAEPIDLDKAQALADAATEGPWAIWHDLDHQGFTTVGDAAGVIPEGEDYIDGEWTNPTAHVYTEADAEFIAQARTLVPTLIAELRGYREEKRQDEEWNRRVDKDNVRCLDCDLRHGEREEYRCTKASGAHTYVFSEDGLRSSREGGK